MSSSPKQHAEIAQGLAQVHNQLAAAIHDLVCLAGGGMLQLRCHERGVDGHDDIVKVMSTDLSEMLGKIVTGLLKLLDDDNGYKNDAVTRNVVDRMLAMAYGKCVAEMLHKYDRAFTSKLAPIIIDATAYNVKTSIDQVCRMLVVMHVYGLYAKAERVVDNADVAEVVREYVEGAMAHGIGEIQASYDKATPELDALALAENTYFNELVVQGVASDTALDMVTKKFEARIMQLLEAQKEEGDTR